MDHQPPGYKPFTPKYTQHRDEAKELYVHKHWTYTEIAEYFKIPRTAVRDWACKDKWAAERDGLVLSEAQDLAKRKSYTLNQLMNKGLTAITKGLDDACKRTLTIEEIHQVSQTMSNLDKLIRLANGQATEITEQRNLNVTLPQRPLETKEDIEAAFKILKESDPFTVAREGEGDDDTSDDS